MKFSVTRQGGQYQFWHTDCEKSRSGIMSEPEFLDDNFKRFKCLHCKKTGVVQTDKIVEGHGVLFEPIPPETREILEEFSGMDVDMDSPLQDEAEDP